MRIPWGFVDAWKGDVGDVRRWVSLVRIWGGKVVVLGGQRVLSLSRTRAWMVGTRFGVGFSGRLDLEVPVVCAPTRCGPRSSGRYVNVGMVRCGRNWEGCLRRVWTAWLKPRRLELGEPAMASSWILSRCERSPLWLLYVHLRA